MATGIPSGLGATAGFIQEAVVGTYLTPTRWVQFDKEALKLKKKALQGAGLHGGLYELALRRVYTNRMTDGPIDFDIVDRSLGLFLSNMIGSTVILGTPASGVTLQTHAAGSLNGKTLACQIGRPSTDGTINAFSYNGLKVVDWEIACAVEQFAKLTLTLDGWDEVTATGYTAASFLAANPLTFAGGTVILGGAVTTTTGIASVAGGVTIPVVKAATVKGSNALDTQRFFLGTSVKKEQIENGYRKLTGTLEVEFENLTDTYTAFAADTAVAVQLNFIGPIVGGAIHSFLNVLIPSVRLEEGPPNVDGPKVLTQKVTFTGLDDGVNTPIQFQYSSLDAAQ